MEAWAKPFASAKNLTILDGSDGMGRALASGGQTAMAVLNMLGIGSNGHTSPTPDGPPTPGDIDQHFAALQREEARTKK